MKRAHRAALLALSLAALAAAAANIALATANRAAQAEVAQRQQSLQQAAQLEALHRQLAQALAELSVRHADEPLRALLARHGIGYDAGAAAAGTRR